MWKQGVSLPKSTQCIPVGVGSAVSQALQGGSLVDIGGISFAWHRTLNDITRKTHGETSYYAKRLSEVRGGSLDGAVRRFRSFKSTYTKKRRTRPPLSADAERACLRLE